MPLLHHNGRRILFIHIPKTGGTTITNWLLELGEVDFFDQGVSDGLRVPPQHFTLADHLAIHSAASWDYVFAVVRNPYDRLRSEHHWQTETQKGRSGHRTDFSRWAENNLRNFQRSNPTYLDNHIRPQSDFIDSSVEVFRYEDGLEKVCAHLADLLDVPPPTEPLPRSMASTDTSGDTALTPRALILVNRLYDTDFEWFGYKRVGPTLPKVVALDAG